MCTRKRKFRSQGDALDAALVAGVGGGEKPTSARSADSGT